MTRLPIISGKKLLKFLLKYGYREVRRKGSHVFVESVDDNSLSSVIPIHSNEDLGRGILKSILNDLELSVDNLVEML